jgi:hypothetical protein
MLHFIVVIKPRLIPLKIYPTLRYIVILFFFIFRSTGAAMNAMSCLAALYVHPSVSAPITGVASKLELHPIKALVRSMVNPKTAW